MPVPAPRQPPPRLRIEHPEPALDGGRFAPKRCVGDVVQARARIFRDGHDLIRAAVRHRAVGDAEWGETPLTWIDADVDGDTWAGSFQVDRPGAWEFTIAAWTDVWGTWRDELRRKAVAAQPDVSGELSEGAVLLTAAVDRAAGGDRECIAHALAELRDPEVPQASRVDAALGSELDRAVQRAAERHGEAVLEAPLPLWVDRALARFGAWYELFPRSWGGFRGVAEVIPDLAALGFDVLYLPPIHPIGEVNRKGRNNALAAGSGDPGSPWAIGRLGAGGHTAVDPGLGTLADFDALVAAARASGVEIALDYAIQCSADHPWLTEHPEWFHRRPDGTLKYAENPPKRYQDIYNVNWETEDWEGLWQALLDVMLFWVDRGVTVYRVDNPHTKPFAFWEWLIGEVHRRDPGVIFLAEAFTREAKMQTLAKLGFTQSYTYFTWKNARWELAEYVEHLAYSGMQEYFRPNFFANTPDILHAYLQHGGEPAFHARLVLAGTLSPAYGLYSGFEHFENVPVREGSEEYLDSEKYEIKARALDGPLLGEIRRLNEIRRAHPALQRLDDVEFLDARNEGLLAYAKRWGDDLVLVVVNLDTTWPQEGLVTVPAHLGLPPAFEVTDELHGGTFTWRIGGNYVRLEPGASHELGRAG
jgi:starch synthase (maltosyl-transferring)